MIICTFDIRNTSETHNKLKVGALIAHPEFPKLINGLHIRSMSNHEVLRTDK
jgi:hypothetical protein